MRKRDITILSVLASLLFAGVVYAAPGIVYQSNSLLPTITDTFDLGTTSKEWNGGYFKNVTVTGTCTGCGGGGSLTGGTAGMIPAWLTSSSLTSTSTPTVAAIQATSTATSSFQGPIFDFATMAHFGTTTCGTGGLGLSTGFLQGTEYCGNDDTDGGGVQIIGANSGRGARSWTGFTLNNDLADATLTHYTGIYYNSSRYTSTFFGGLFGIPNEAILQTTDGPWVILASTGTTQGYIAFSTGGLASTSERMRVDYNGNIGIASSSPFGRLSINLNTYATTAGPAFIIASSTATATSTLFQVNNVGSTTIGLLGTCSGGNALNTTAAGLITCGAVSSSLAVPFNFNLLNTWSTSTAATTTSIWTQGVFFSSSTVAASQLPYATTTALSGNFLFANTNIVIGTGTISTMLTMDGRDSTTFTAGGAGYTVQQTLQNDDQTNNNGAQIRFRTTDAAGTQKTAATIFGGISSHVTNAVSSFLDFGVINAGTWVDAFRIVNTGSVGISTTTPWAEFSIQANATQGVANNGAIFVIASSTLTTTSTLLYAGNTGNVGVGTSTPDAAFSISNAINNAAALIIHTWTNVTNALSVVNAAGTTVFGVDTTPTDHAHVLSGTTTSQTYLGVQLNNGEANALLPFIIASSTATATTTLFSITNAGHLIASSTNPVLTCTGGSVTSMTGDDARGEAVCGTGSTAAVVTFGQAWSNAPICVVSNQSMSITSAMSYTISTTALTMSQAVGLAGDKLDYLCEGLKGQE